MNIYYQDEFLGKEIAKSLSRFVHYCLGEKSTPIKIGWNSEKILTNNNDNQILIFTNLIDDLENWGTLLGKISKKIKEKKWKLRIIDLTMQELFPIITVPSNVVISSNKDLEWLSKLTIIKDAEEVQIKFGKDFIEKYYSSIDHKK